MGSWSVNCGISNITITSGEECVLLPLKKNRGEYLPYLPATLPIFGTYDDYGGLDKIVENENTKLIEEHFGMEIHDFCQYFTRGCIDPDDVTSDEDINNFSELRDWKFMFIDGEVYKFLSSSAHEGYGGAGHLDFGNPELLTLLGFTYIGETESSPMTHDPKRWKHEWEYNDKKFYADGTWIQYINENGVQQSIYNFTGKYTSLENAIGEIPEDKRWIGEKAKWQLWEYLHLKKQKELLTWIIGERYEGLEDFYEGLSYEIREKLGYNKPVLKTISQKYKNDITKFGSGLCELVTIRHNIHCMSGHFVPYILYLTPQCGEFRQHQVLLDKFAEINRARSVDEGEDDEE